MKIIDDQLRKSFRGFICEWCRHTHAVFAAHWGIECAHIYSKGAGQVDIVENLCSLCRLCHSRNHAGQRPTREDLLELVAERERMTPREITDLVALIRRTPKPLGYEDMTPAELREYAVSRKERVA